MSKKKIVQILVNIPFVGIIKLQNNSDYIFDTPCREWINNNNIEDYKFIDVIHEGIEYKLPVTDIKFIY